MGEQPPFQQFQKTSPDYLARVKFHKAYLKVIGFIALPYNVEPTPSFDLMQGFPQARKERVSKLSLEQMEDYAIPANRRDYCAHHYVDYEKCKRMNVGFGMKRKCAHAHHEYKTCEFEDLVLRTKEFEREKRMLARQKRRIEKGLEDPIPEKWQPKVFDKPF